MANTIHPTAIVEDGATLGDGVQIGPYCIVGADSRLGDGVQMLSHAIVTGRTQMAGTYLGQKMDVTLRFTDVFVRRDGEWKCIASQGTFVND